MTDFTSSERELANQLYDVHCEANEDGKFENWLLLAREIQKKQRNDIAMLWMTVYDRLDEIKYFISGNQWSEPDWKEWVAELKSHFLKGEDK